MATSSAGTKQLYSANEDGLLMKGGSQHLTSKASLFRKRIVVNQETDEGQRLNESLVKRLSGGDQITARRMREDEWTFDPTHTMFLATNNRPVVKSTGNAIWRRLRLVPFEVSIPESEQDHMLPSKLKAELPGIMAWLVRGHADWLQNGLGEPVEVTEATEDYRNEMDVVGTFIEEECVIGSNLKAKAQDLQDAFAEWTRSHQEAQLTTRELSNRLEDRGIEKKRANSGVYYIGIGLFSPDGPSISTGKNTIVEAIRRAKRDHTRRFEALGKDANEIALFLMENDCLEDAPDLKDIEEAIR